MVKSEASDNAASPEVAAAKSQPEMKAATKPTARSARKAAVPKVAKKVAAKKTVAAQPPARKSTTTKKVAASAAETVAPEVTVVRQLLQPTPPHRGKRSASEQIIDEALPQLEAHVARLVDERDTAKRGLAQTISKNEGQARETAQRVEEISRSAQEAREAAADATNALLFERRFFQPLTVQIARLTDGEVYRWVPTGSRATHETHRAEANGVQFALSAVNGEAFLGVNFPVGRRPQTFPLRADIGLEPRQALALHHLLTATDDELLASLPQEALDEIFTATFLQRRRARNVGFGGAARQSSLALSERAIAVGKRVLAGATEPDPLSGLRYRPQSGLEMPEG